MGATDSEAVEEAAVRWFIRREGGAWTDAQEAEFNVWLDGATAHRVAYLRVETAWQQSARMKALGAGVPSGVIPPPGEWGNTRFLKKTTAELQPAPVTSPEDSTQQVKFADVVTGHESARPATSRVSSRGLGLRFNAVAAGLLVALAAGAALYIYTSGYFAGDRYATAVGGLDNVRLADGSHVTLNTDTSIRVRMTAKERHIDLVRGEAFFEVAKDPAHPFVVYAADQRIVAVGTKFAVRRDSEDVQIVVTEGEVRLAGADASEPIPVPTMLHAGAVAKTSRKEVIVNQDAAPDTQRLLSWRVGYVNFQDTTLSDAVAEFNRYNTRKIVIADPALAELRIGGNFRSNNTHAFLSLLQDRFPVTVEEGEDQVVLRGR